MRRRPLHTKTGQNRPTHNTSATPAPMSITEALVPSFRRGCVLSNAATSEVRPRDSGGGDGAGTIARSSTGIDTTSRPRKVLAAAVDAMARARAARAAARPEATLEIARDIARLVGVA